MTTATSRDARLDLAIRVQVAQFRLADAKEEHAAAIARADALMEALHRFKTSHGHDFHPANPGDARLMAPLLRGTGAGRLTWEDLEAGAAAHEAVRACYETFIVAARALSAAWDQRSDQTLIEWVGISSEEFRAAVEARLLAEDAVEAELAERLAGGRVWQCSRCRAAFTSTRWPRPASGRCDECAAGSTR